VTAPAVPGAGDPRPALLRRAGLASGLAAGAWLGAAEAPTKLVAAGLPPVVISLAMVLGVFCARWSLPALLQGTAAVGAEVRRAPHLVVWAVLGGALWSVANTLTVYAVRDIGLAIAFPLWNANSLLGIAYGALFFNELRGASRAQRGLVLGGAAAMLAGGTVLAVASAAGRPGADALRGVAAALGAGVLWGTMYIPYRKAYLTGMSPLAFVTFFTVGEVATMTALALWLTGGPAPLAAALASARPVLFFLFAGGFVWVVGDLFQQYAAKYLGISRGIPLSNTNQLWGLLWGVLVFGELRGRGAPLGPVVAGSLVMAAGAALVALAAPRAAERAEWAAAADREARRYGVDPAWVRARLAGESGETRVFRRRPVDWAIALAATAVFVWLALQARAPEIRVAAGGAAALVVASVAVLAVAGTLLWRATRFR
jgi:drug/metabolite transporter (DMT)-like permease